MLKDGNGNDNNNNNNNDNGNRPPRETDSGQAAGNGSGQVDLMADASDAGGNAGKGAEAEGGDAAGADHEDVGADWTDAHEADEDDAGGEPSPGRKRIRNAVIVLLAAALLANVLALWPRIFNMQTLTLLFQSRELSGRADIESFKNAVVLVGTDRGKGSGFHVSGGYIVTNHHVIEDASYIIVEFSGINERFAADVAKSDPEMDLAVLSISGGERLPYIEIEREHRWESGDRVYVIGNPLMLKQIAVEGEILGLAPVRGKREPVMMIDATVHRGSSGSPVINEHGRAIAVVYAISEMARDGSTEAVGLAVPLSVPDTLLSDLGLPPGY